MRRFSVATTDSIGAAQCCTTCRQTKPLDMFAKEGDKRRRQCKACRAAALKARRAKLTPEQKAQYYASCKAYVEANREAVLAKKREYYWANAEELSRQQKERYRRPEHQATVKARAKEWRKANPERKAKANKEWAAANPDRANAAYRASKARRRKNPAYRINASVGTQMRLAMSERKAGRRWESIVGYTLADLMTHLERQFLRGMTWGNYGTEWHLDHIVPQVSFELRGADEATVRACWALSNLRPLWAVPNMSKGARRTHLL
jgi:hypothetical protein